MLELNRLDLTDDPIVIALRRHMKGELLRRLDFASKKSPLDDKIKIVIYGSTLMRELVENFGVRFPFPGVKSSDIDAGAYLQKGPYLNPNEETYLEAVCPIFRQAIFDAGYTLKRPANTIGTSFTTFESADIIDLPLKHFIDDYYLTHSFTPKDIKYLLRDKWEELEPYLSPDKNIEVHLSISSHQKHFPIIMKPIPMYSRIDNEPLEIEDVSQPALSSLCRADRYDMLAGKLARCFTGNFKPTDLIDIYNLCHGTMEDGKTPALEMGQDGFRDHRNVLRLLVLHYIMMSNESLPDLENPSLLAPFEPSEKGVERFNKAIAEQVAQHKQQLLLEKRSDIFSACSQLLGSIFPEGPEGEKRIGPLHLKEKEVEYILGYYGRVLPKPPPQKPDSVFTGITSLFSSLLGGNILKPLRDTAEQQASYSGIFKDATYARNTFGHLDCKMNLELLESLYPEVATNYPGIFINLRRHDLLTGLMNERINGKDVSHYGIE